MKVLTGALTLALILATLLTAGTAVSNYHRVYMQTCPSKDVLQWDGNIRMIQALDRFQDLRAGNIGNVVASYYRANTWPPLRPTISLLLFGLSSNGPSAEADTLISLFFYALLFPSLIFIGMRMAPTALTGAAAAFLTSLLLIHSKQLPAYSLASMLETQGMFFLLWAVYFIFRAYQQLYPRPEDIPADQITTFRFPRNESERTVSRGVKIGLVVSILGVTLSKYPYAVMLFIGLAVCEFARAPGSYIGFARRALGDYYGKGRLAVYALIIGGLIALIIAAKMGKIGPKGTNERGVRYAMYLVALIIFVDFNIYAWRFRAALADIVPASMRHFYVLGIFPTLVWLFSNPDRFSAVIGGTQWVPPPGLDTSKLFRSSFFDTLLNHTFDQTWPIALVLGGMLLGIGAYKLARFSRMPGGEPPGEGSVFRSAFAFALGLLQSPLVAVTVILWVQFLAQEFLSPNKQDRHIFHFLPALVLLAVIWITRIPGALNERSNSRKWDFAGPALALLLTALGASMLYMQNGLFTEGYFSANARPFCYSGDKREFFDPARWTANTIDPKKKHIIINNMYNVPPKPPVLRQQGTEIDLLLRTRAIPAGGTAYNDNRHLFKSWGDFDRLLIITPGCDGPGAMKVASARAAKVGAKLGASKVSTHPSGQFCVNEIDLK